MPKVTSLSCCHVWFASVNTFYSPIWHVTSLFFFFFFWLELMEWCKFSLAYIHILTITKFSTTWNVPQCDITIQWSFLGDGYWYLGRYGFKISFIVSNHYWGCWFLWGKYFFTLDLSLTLQDHVCPSWELRVPELAPLQPYDFGDTSYGCHADISISGNPQLGQKASMLRSDSFVGQMCIGERAVGEKHYQWYSCWNGIRRISLLGNYQSPLFNLWLRY